jgi:hypothetical protein
MPQRKTRCGIYGAERDRTADPLLAKQVLSQLSYSPEDVEISGFLTGLQPHFRRPIYPTHADVIVPVTAITVTAAPYRYVAGRLR